MIKSRRKGTEIEHVKGRGGKLNSVCGCFIINWNAILMTRHFLFVDLTLTHLISLEEIIAIVTESALLGCFLAGSKGTVWRKHIIFTRCPSEGHTHLCVSCKVSGPWSNQGGGLRSCICLEFFSDHFPVPAPDDNKPKLFKYQNGFSSYQMKILSLVTHTPAPSVWVTCSNFSLVTSQMI